MSNVILFPTTTKANHSSKPTLRKEDMDWSKLVDDVQLTKKSELIRILKPTYEKLLEEMRDGSISDSRHRFLNQVKDSFEKYLLPEGNDNTQYPLFYLILYYIGIDNDRFYAEMDDKEVVYLKYDASELNRTVAFMIEHFRTPVYNDINMIELFLSYVSYM